MLPEDWRQQVTAMVSGRQPLAGELFQGGLALGPVDQIGVYARQYRIRLYDALEEEVVGLKVLLGDALEPLLRAYLEDCPSQSWTLERVADRLESWLKKRGAPVEQIEMARLDRAVQAGFNAGDGTPLDLAQLQTLPDLELQPPVHLLRLTTNIHEIRSAANTGTVPPLQTGIDVHLVVFRRGFKLQHIVLEAGAWHLLEGFADGLSVSDALERLVDNGVKEPSDVAASVQRWFLDFGAHGLVQVKP